MLYTSSSSVIFTCPTATARQSTYNRAKKKKGQVKYRRDDRGAFEAAGRKQGAHLLHLEFDSRLDLVHLGHHVLIVSEQGGELASLVQPRAQDTRDLLDQRLRGQEGIVLLS